MSSFKLTALALCLGCSSIVYAQNTTVTDIAKIAADQAIEMADEGQNKGVAGKLSFPKAAIDSKGSSKNTWKFTESEVRSHTSPSHIREMQRLANTFRPIFSTALLSGGVGTTPASTDVTLLLAIATKESRFNPKAVSDTGARGIMQITKTFYQDVTGLLNGVQTNKGGPLRPRGLAISSSINDSFTPSIGIKLASIGLTHLDGYLKDSKWTDPSGLPRNNVANLVRAYNAGQGEVFSNGTKERLVNGVNKQGFQYPYYVGYYYYALGGSKPYFKHFFEGNDPYLISRGMGGSGSFDIQTSNEEPNVEPYKIPAQQCAANYQSPLDQALVVAGTYGSRYDYEQQRSRSKNSVDFVAALNTPVKAMGDGVVVGVDRSAEMDTTLLIKNTNGTVFAYGSVKDVSVAGGQSVKQGEVIAKVADTNAAKSPQLMISYFPDGSGNLSLAEGNGNHEDPLAVYCGAVDIPAEMLTNTGALSEMITSVTQETADSLSGAISAMIDNRLSNKQWLIDISKMEAPRLYAELAYINAISLKQDQMLNSIQERTEGIIATGTSLTNDNVLGKEAKEKEMVIKQ